MRVHPVIFESSDKFVSPAGNRIHIHYEPRFDGERTILVECGSSDIQASINSFAPFCDIEYMLSRLRIGDSSVLSSRQPLFGDFSGLSSNPADVLNIVHSAEYHFALLSSEERQDYNNDFRVWLSAMLRNDNRPAGNSASVQPAPKPDHVSEV